MKLRKVRKPRAPLERTDTPIYTTRRGEKVEQFRRREAGGTETLFERVRSPSGIVWYQLVD